jgi:tetratricopeptide (TPR) repeat protein
MGPMGSSNPSPSGAEDDVLIHWVNWLDDYIGGLAALPGETATDFCCAATDEWQRSVMPQPPAPDSAAMLLLLEAVRALTQVGLSAALDERITRGAADAALRAALEGVRNDAQRWIDNGPPSAEEIQDGVKAVGATLKQAQDALAERVAEDEADDAYAREHPYGAILGYQDPQVEADIIFTQVSELTEDEQNQYAEAHDRLRQLIDQDLFSYVSDSSDVFLGVVGDVLRDIQNQAFSLTNMDESHKRIRRIRSALIAFTSALHIHQDQTYYKIKHKFGDESDEHKAVRKLFNGIYSDCFGYRWLTELRHVMLHIDMNAFTIAFKAQLNALAEVVLGMSRHWMSKSSGVMDKAYKRTELEAMTEDPSVLDMIKVLIPAFGPLQDKIDAIMFPAAEVANDVETVRELIGRFNGRRGMYALQTGPGFTRRLRTPSFSPLDPRVLAFADGYEPPDQS